MLQKTLVDLNLVVRYRIVIHILLYVSKEIWQILIHKQVELHMPYSWKVWQGIKFGGLIVCLHNCEIKIYQISLLTYNICTAVRTNHQVYFPAKLSGYIVYAALLVYWSRDILIRAHHVVVVFMFMCPMIASLVCLASWEVEVLVRKPLFI